MKNKKLKIALVDCLLNNWLFFATPGGTQASASLYNLIVTAKAKKMLPYKYFRYLYEKVPFFSSEKELANLQSINLPSGGLRLEAAATGVSLSVAIFHQQRTNF